VCEEHPSPFDSRESMEKIVEDAGADSLAEIMATSCVFGQP
jgi:hypothetical protein